MISIALVFDHRARTSKDKEGPIEIRVNINNVIRYASTGVKVLRKHWQSGLVVDRYDCAELNERLSLIKRKAESEINKAIEHDLPINFADIRRKITTLDVTSRKDDFIDWIIEILPLMPTTEQRKEHYLTLVSRLRESKIIRSFADITVENIYKFDSWLHTLTKGKDKLPLAQGTIYNYHKNLKAILNMAVKFDRLERNPYERMRNEFSRGEKESIEYLTEEEMHRIEDLVLLPGELATARDLFVVQMYTGLAYSDAQALDLEQYKQVNGKWLNNAQRIKTGVTYVSQLLPPVIKVLERHGWQVPKIALQHYNENLKLLGKAAGIACKMHSHLARHTFATYMLRNGVKIENLQKMLGHKRITQTMRYSKVLAESVHEDFDKIYTKLNK